MVFPPTSGYRGGGCQLQGVPLPSYKPALISVPGSEVLGCVCMDVHVWVVMLMWAYVCAVYARSCVMCVSEVWVIQV